LAGGSHVLLLPEIFAFLISEIHISFHFTLFGKNNVFLN
jgi:hypothetical protein